MRIFLIFFCLLMLSSCSDEVSEVFGIKTVASHNLIENGGVFFLEGSQKPFNGRSLEYKDGSVYKNKYYKEGVVYLVERYKNEELRSSIEYESNKPHGNSKYYDDGILLETGQFYKGNPVGVWHYPNTEDETLREGILFKALEDGFVGGFYPSGELQQIGEFKDGEPHGLWKFYDLSGETIAVQNYKSGELEGMLSHYENGRLID